MVSLRNLLSIGRVSDAMSRHAVYRGARLSLGLRHPTEQRDTDRFLRNLLSFRRGSVVTSDPRLHRGQA